VLRVTAWPDCREVRLAGAEPSNQSCERTLLAPFDRFEPVRATRSVRGVSRRRWMRGLADAIGAVRPVDGLQAAHRAALELLPWQLEPALALATGAASRILVADDVGLGKTVQALVALVELAARGEADRALVVTPAGLREQWASELRDRFGGACQIVDAPFLAAAGRELPPGVNPWSLARIYVVSLDFLKRAEVRRGIEALWWDVLIVDEAHLAAPGTDRHAAVARIALRAGRVLLLTATPYAADADGFAALCDIGRAGSTQTRDDLRVFRRSRRAVQLGGSVRRSRVIRVRSTPEERRMHRLLDRYTQRIWRAAAEAGQGPMTGGTARLAMTVLRKRALSSAWALHRTVERRIALLEKVDPEQVSKTLSLPFDPDDEDEASADADVSDAIVGAPGLADTAAERTALLAIAAAATAAAARESKIAALSRILRRTGEPVIIFTEYRDTLQHLAERLAPLRPHAALHGGLSLEERGAAARALNQGRVTLLLATDAAGEGLNLHHRCRWVINFELPWNPSRLEQRAGRVDRFGQRRIPHAWHLVAANTAESMVLARLAARLDRARLAGWLGAGLERLTEPKIADAIFEGSDCGVRIMACGFPLSPQSLVHDPQLEAAAAEACREAGMRRRVRSSTRAPDAETLVLTIDSRRLARGRTPLDRLVASDQALRVMRLDVRDGSGRVADSTLIGVVRPDGEGEGARLDLERQMRFERVADIRRASAACLIDRYQALAALASRTPAAAVQPALFDRRALDTAEAERDASAALAHDLGLRLERLERARSLTSEPAEPILVAVREQGRGDSGRPPQTPRSPCDSA
jgi:superfamily II DNA or RNA helicase